MTDAAATHGLLSPFPSDYEQLSQPLFAARGIFTMAQSTLPADASPAGGIGPTAATLGIRGLDFATGVVNLAKDAARTQTLPDSRMYPDSLNLRSASGSSADEAFVAAVRHGAVEELSAAPAMVEHCLAQLTFEQIWHRDQPSLHAIGNVVLHLGGNLRQWIVCGLGGAPDERRRPEEFAASRPITGSQLLGDLRASVDEARQVSAKMTTAELLRVRRIQGFEMTGIAALWHAVPHFRGHTQELIRLTREALGSAYRFAWTPTTPEEGAPS